MSALRLGGLARTVASGALGALSRLDPGRPDVVAVLTYHRIAEPGAPVPPGLASTDRASFDRQMAMLAGAYHPITLAELVARRDGGPALPPRSVLVTFDDGYRDFADVAWPILRARGIPVVLFVPTGAPGGGAPFWWDRLHRAIREAAAASSWVTPAGTLRITSAAERDDAYRRLRGTVKRLPSDEAAALVDALVAELAGRSAAAKANPPAVEVLGWPDLVALASAGVTLAPHSRTHPQLTRVSDTALDEEIGGSRDDLAQRLDSPPSPAFAYPSGEHSARVRDAVERNGFTVAFSTERGLNDLRTRIDWYAIRRINVGRRTSESAIRAQLDTRVGPLVAAAARRGRRGSAPGRTTHLVASGRG